MGYRRDALGFEISDRLGDGVAEIDAADPLVAFLDAGRLALNLDLEPDATDAGGLHGEVAGLARYAGVGFVASNHGVERAVAAHFLVNDDVDHDVAPRRQSEILEILYGEDVTRGAAFHIAGAAPIYASFLDARRPRIVAPALPGAHWNHVGVAIEQKRPATAGALQYSDDVGSPLIATLDRPITGVLLERFPVGLPHVDLEANLAHGLRDELLYRRLIPRDARNGDHLPQKVDRLVAASVDLVEDFLMVGIGHFAAFLAARPHVDQSDFNRGMISRAIVST